MGNFLKWSELQEITSGPLDYSDDPGVAHIDLIVKSVVTSCGIFNEPTGISIIHPQQIISVITEDIALKNTDIGFIAPKMRLHRMGLLMLPAGCIVHPTYKGPVTLQLVNFSKGDISISVGDTVAELLIYRNDNAYKYGSLPAKDAYLNERLKEIQNYPLNFMETKDNEKWLSEKTGLKYVKCLSFCIALLTLFLTVWTIIYTMNSSTEVNKLNQYVDALNGLEKTDGLKELKKVYELRLKALESKLEGRFDDFEKSIQDLRK